MTAAVMLLWLGLYGLVLFGTFDAPMSKKDMRWWVLGSAIVATMLAIPVMMILLAMQMLLLK